MKTVQQASGLLIEQYLRLCAYPLVDLNGFKQIHQHFTQLIDLFGQTEVQEILISYMLSKKTY